MTLKESWKKRKDEVLMHEDFESCLDAFEMGKQVFAQLLCEKLSHVSAGSYEFDLLLREMYEFSYNENT